MFAFVCWFASLLLFVCLFVCFVLFAEVAVKEEDDEGRDRFQAK